MASVAGVLRLSCNRHGESRRGVAIQLAVFLDHHGASAPRDDG